MGVGPSITGCKLGRRVGCGASLCRSRGSPLRRRASSAGSRVDEGNTPPIVGCGEGFSRELGAPGAKNTFSLLLPLFAGSGGDSRLLCSGTQIRPALQRNHINEPPIMTIKKAMAVNIPVTSPIICKTSTRRNHQMSRAHLYSKRRFCIRRGYQYLLQNGMRAEMHTRGCFLRSRST